MSTAHGHAAIFHMKEERRSPPAPSRRPAPSRARIQSAPPAPSPYQRLVAIRQKRLRRLHRLAILLALCAALLVIVAVAGLATRYIYLHLPDPDAPLGDDIPDQPAETGSSIATPGSHPFADGPTEGLTFPFADSNQVISAGSLESKRAVLVDLSSGEVIASRLGDEKMYPASMTKVMTLIVAVENLPEEVSLSYKVTVSQEVYDQMVRAGSSGVGLEPGEQLSVESLLYLTILRSDGIAATELARYIAGSEEEFVSLMNRKASEMGLENTHFANPTGLQNEANYSTCRDMAAILSYAMRMTLCRKVLTTASYDAFCTATEGKNAGKSFNYFAYHHLLTTLMTEKYPGYKPAFLTITAGKTGYAGTHSGYCLASYAVGANGQAYICVTSQALPESDGYRACLKDHKWIYDTYAKE